MTFLPVVERELRVTARNRRLYWGRCVAAFISLLLVIWFLLTFARGSNSAQNAMQIFWGLSAFAFLYCLVGGLFLTADCISEEKREGTLGLLFLTNLKGYDVAFGKLAATSLRAVYSVLAIYPILTIPLLLGGIEFAEIGRMALVLLVTLIFSLCIGLFVSSCSREDRKAQLGAFILMLFIAGLVPGIIGLLRSHYHFALPKALFAITPCFAFFTAFSSAYKGPDIELFWISVALITGLSWFAFIAAATIIRRAWHDRPDTLLLMGWRGPWRSWVEGVRRRASYRQALLSVNPYYWLAARNPLKPYYVFWFLGICGAIWFILWCYNGRQMLEMEAFFTCAALLQTGVKIWFASEAGRQLHEDRKSSALELTLSTPLPVREILEGQFLALLRQFGAPIAVILCFDVTGMIVGAHMRFSSDTEWILTWVAMIIIFLVDIMTISALGMWLGLSRKRAGRAIAQTLFSVLGLPWLVLFGMVTYMSLVNFSQMGSANFFIGAYFVVSLVIDFVLFLNASGNLTSRFRQVATQRFDVSR